MSSTRSLRLIQRTLCSRPLSTSTSRFITVTSTSTSRIPIPTLFTKSSSSRLYSTEKKNESNGEKVQEQGQKESATEQQQQQQVDLAEFDKVKKQLTDSEKKVAELKDAYLRAVAENENIRQRSKKEQEAISHYAIQKFSKDLLDTADVLEMALNSVKESDRSDPASPLSQFWVGVNMIKTNLLKAFERHGVTPYNPMGEKFDANLHQALFQSPMEGKEPGTIFHVAKTGYMIHGRVLRAADVGVVKGE